MQGQHYLRQQDAGAEIKFRAWSPPGARLDFFSVIFLSDAEGMWAMLVDQAGTASVNRV
jgi:hypothetical protein